MNQLQQGLLPLDDLDATQFETFLLLFLGAGISLDVFEPAPPGSDKPSHSVRVRLINVTKYGGPGVEQRGIDLRAKTEHGLEWVFQCKHSPKFTPALARAALKKAEKEYPDAARYFLVLSGEPTAKVRDVVEAQPKWELWGQSELNVKFFNELPRLKQLDILRQVFPSSVEGIIRRLFPQHDDLLIEPGQFFARWIEEGRIFHHRAALVGREEPLKAMHEFVADPNQQILILPAPGGVGKTRLLRALGDTFTSEHPDKKLWFVDPTPRPGVDSDRLRGARNDELVVVHDDAHRSETLRQDLVASVLEKQGKLIFATRPHGVDALLGWLGQIGAEQARITVLPALPPLSRPDMIKLADACLPEGKKSLAENLAELSKGCALIVTVGAQLIGKDEIPPAAFLDSQVFQNEVFKRFEGAGMAQVTTQEHARRLRNTLRLISVLAPWKEQDVSLEQVAAIVESSPKTFRQDLELLEAAGLIAKTGEGRRVIPDLLADHLVYRGCYDVRGQLTDFARRLQKDLSGTTKGTVLRNLAEAEWQAQHNDKNVESLLDPFWKDFLGSFEKQNFWERSRLIVEWRRFAVYQPERSLKLARLAIDLKDAPPPPEDRLDIRGVCSLNTQDRVLGELPTMLEPIAVYHADFRNWALDLLWELHLKHGRIDQNAQNDPIVRIGRVAKFEHHHPADAPLAVVRWLADRLRDPNMAGHFDRLTPALSVMLKPICEHEVELSSTSGRTILFQSYALSPSEARPVREEALALLRDHVIPRGEIATLNALSVLDAAVDIARRRWGVSEEVEKEMQKLWLPERLTALRLVESLITPGQSVRVLFRIMRLLRPHTCRDSEEFKTECRRLLGLIPDSHDLRMVRLLTSEAWEEFYHNSEREESSVEESSSLIEGIWSQFADEIALQVLRSTPTAQAIVAAVESLATDYRRVGFSPQFHHLFQAIARQDKDLADECLDTQLSQQISPVDYWWPHWIFGQHKLPDSRLLNWIKLVLRGDNIERWRSLHWALRWKEIGEIGEEVLSEIGAWSRRLNDTTFEVATAQLRWRGIGDNLIDRTILINLNLSALSDKSLKVLAASLCRAPLTNSKSFPSVFTTRFIEELRRVENLHDHEARFFWRYLAEAEPLRYFEMLKLRIIETGQRRATHQAYDPLMIFERPALTDLPRTTNYSSLVEDLFERWRGAGKEHRGWWRSLFQDAVLRVSPLGLECLRRWLANASSAEDIEQIVWALKFTGSLVIFEHPDFVHDLLKKIWTHAPAKKRELEWALRDSASPSKRGYTNDTLDPEYRYYREEAAKAAEVHARIPELAAFYREIVRSEDADTEWRRRNFTAPFDEWN